MRRGFGSHRTVFVEHLGFQDRQGAFLFHLMADDLYRFPDEYGGARESILPV